MDIIADGPTLVLEGVFDVRSTSEVRNAIYDHLYVHGGDISLDVSRVDAMDLTALRVVAAASRWATRSGQRIVLRGVPPTVLRMLHMSHLIRLVELERGAVAGA